MPYHMTDAERDQLRDLVTRMYAEGRSIRQIAVDTGRAYSTVRRALADADTPMRGRGWTQPQPRSS